MKWLVRVVVALIVFVVVLFAAGFLLPAQFKVQRSIDIAAPAGNVYALIVDPREWKRWAVWNERDPAMKIEYSGAASGPGARWSWRSKTEGNGSMEFTEAALDKRLGYKLDFPDFGMQSNGMLTLVPAGPQGPGVHLTWTMEGTLGSNPMHRWLGVFMDKMVGADFEGGLRNLKRLAEAR